MLVVVLDAGVDHRASCVVRCYSMLGVGVNVDGTEDKGAGNEGCMMGDAHLPRSLNVNGAEDEWGMLTCHSRYRRWPAHVLAQISKCCDYNIYKPRTRTRTLGTSVVPQKEMDLQTDHNMASGTSR